MLENKPTTTADGTFVITRVFSAPRHLVWAAWSGAEQMQKWWGPKGCSIKIAKFEFRPGGFLQYAISLSRHRGTGAHCVAPFN
ncbi:MAG: SRPBCC domain-containing protein, partial [Xanthobacteraceae bacterium]